MILYIIQLLIVLYFLGVNIYSAGKSCYKHGELNNNSEWTVFGLIRFFVTYIGSIIIVYLGEGSQYFNPFCWQMWIMHSFFIIGMFMGIYLLKHPNNESKYSGPASVIILVIIILLRYYAGFFWPFEVLFK